jgi:hypothetical protein
MNKRNCMAVRACLPVGLALVLGVVACGGNDSGGNDTSMAGTSATGHGGSASSGGGSSSTAGSTSKAGGTSVAGSTGTAGSGTGSGGDFDTGLPADKPIATLTDAEVASLCSKFDDFYSKGTVATNLKNFSCSFSGFLAAALGGADSDASARTLCKAAYDGCIAEPGETTSECTKPSAECTATVGEVEACANDSAKYLAQLGDVFPSCAELTLADLMDMDAVMPPDEPSSCTTLDMKCPDAPMTPSGM